MSDMLASKLGLTTTVAASLKSILTASDATIQPLQKTAGDAAKALHDSLSATTFDAAAVGTLAAAAQKAEGDVIAASIDVWTQLRGILTADQVAKLQPGPPPSGSGSSGSASTAGRR